MSENKHTIIPMGEKVIYAFDASILNKGSASQQKPVQPVKDDIDYSSCDYIPWFENNDFPQRLIKLYEKNDVMPGALDILARACYGQGFQYGYKKIVDGQLVLEPDYNEDVEAWLLENNLEAYAQEAAHDVFWFRNTFPQLVPNLGGDKIKYLHEIDASMCRMGKQKTKGADKGQIRSVYVAADWENRTDSPDPTPAVDCYHGALKQALILTKARKSFIAPQYKRINGRVAYELPIHYAIELSGWLEISRLIPIAKKAALNKNANIGYHIEIDIAYWKSAYPDWDNLTPEKKNDIKQEEVKFFLKNMVGPEGNRVVVTGTFQQQGKTGLEKYHMWEITEMKGSRIEAKFIEDTREVDHHIMRSAGIHSSQMGSGPSKGFSAGSGAVERVSFNNMVLTLKAEQDQIWWPMNNLVIPINGWNKNDSKEKGKFCFWFTNFFIATLDSGKEVSNKEEDQS